jgi:hypothetical protein
LKQLEPEELFSGGWVKIHRSILLHPVFQDSELLHLFLYCIAKANHRDGRLLWKGKESTLERGQFVFGRKSASKETGIKQSTIYRKMMILKTMEMIDIEPNNKFSTVTVLNYGKYQDVPAEVEQQVNRGDATIFDENFCKTQNSDSKVSTSLPPINSIESDGYRSDTLFTEQQNEQQVDNNLTTTEQQVNTNKNNKNEKNDKNKRKVFSFDSIEYELSKLLLTEIRKNDGNFLASNPDAEAPSLQRWALQIDRLIRLDHRPPEEIRQVIVFAQTSSFWRSNILSGQKLREKYTTLLLQMKPQSSKSTVGKVHPNEVLV